MPLLLSQMQKANNDDRVIFKLPEDNDNGLGNGLFFVELETPSGNSKKIRLEMTADDDKLNMFRPLMVSYI